MIMTNVRGVLFNDVVVFGKASAAGNPQSVRTLGGKVSGQQDSDVENWE